MADQFNREYVSPSCADLKEIQEVPEIEDVESSEDENYPDIELGKSLKGPMPTFGALN